MNYRVSLTIKSSNAKTGPIPVSTTSAETCPEACPLAKAGCYAESGPLLIHWRKVTSGQRGVDWKTFCAQIADLPEGTLWRHNQAGDLPGDGVAVDGLALADLIKANTDRRGFTYTHYDPRDTRNAIWISAANLTGFTVNLSANNLEHADDLAALDIGPVVTLLPAGEDYNHTLRTPAGRTVVVCPATYRDDVSCASCALCQVATRSTIVGFPIHGSGAKKAAKHL